MTGRLFAAAQKVVSALIENRRAKDRSRFRIKTADQARRQSDWVAAAEGYRGYLRRHPRDLGVQIRLIRTLYSAGLLEEADAELVKARAARPDKAVLSELAGAIRAARAAIPIADYQLFRQSLRISAPPIRKGGTDGILVIVDGRTSTPDLIEATLDGLRRSKVQAERILVRSDGADAPPWGMAPVLMIEAGTVLDPEALGWLSYTLAVTGAVAAYCDSDRAVGEANTRVWSDPCLYAAPHPLDLTSSPRTPAVILFGAQARPGLTEVSDLRMALAAAIRTGPIAHAPLVLATRLAPEGAEPEISLISDPPEAPDVRIRAIVPTRDEGAVLAAMIESLETKAARRDRLEIVVVDNGSRDSGTLALLERLGREGRIRVLTVDEPFNWSRLNNLAAAGAEAEILLFANNDMRMVTEGWDDRLRRSLCLPGVGVVGARLIYPSGRVQHAGMALGALGGRPVHDGLGAPQDEGGPLDRWRRTRPAAAVTGAFIGVWREVFEQVGGFNCVEFAVSCNDIDFCLRIREQGLSVVYDADLELVHLESYSRGHDDSEAQLRRAQGELDALVHIWEDEARRDPSRNPHWVNHETLLYYGVRQPPLEVVEAWIVRSADAWRVTRRGS